jgi:ABC-type glycerol-3-phosphate transport system substrate-binding protein
MRECIRGDLLEPLDSLPLAAEFEGLAAPLVSSMDILFYNIELLQSAGFDRPPKNQGEFLAAARAVSDPANDRYGAALALAAENPQGVYRDILSWLWMSGASLIQDGSPQFNAPSIIAGLGFLKNLHTEGILSPGSFSKTEEDKMGEFISGRTAMMISSVSDIPRVREKGPSFGITTLPGPALYAGKPIFGVSSWYAGIPRGGPHREEALLFLGFLADQASRLGAAAHAVPPSGMGSGAAGDYISGDPLYSKALDIYESGDSPGELNAVLREAELESLVREEIYRMFEGDQSPEETAAALQEGWQGILEPGEPRGSFL